MLQRMNELAIKAGNETLQSVDKMYIQAELNALYTEINRVAETTTFNEQKLLDGTFSGSKKLQVGAEVQSPNQISITINKMDWASITKGARGDGTDTGYNVTFVGGAPTLSTSEGVLNVTYGYDPVGAPAQRVSDNYESIRSTVSTIKWALKQVSTQRSDMGAVQNRLEHTVANLKNVVENTTAAESAIRDTDMAETMVKFANNSVLAQAGQAMLAQSNQLNQGVLSLL
jgi:flagellin